MERSARQLKPGTRVRLRSASHVLTLESDTGTIVRPDRWDDYYVIRLDRPALYHHADGRLEPLAEIVELLDNLDILAERA